MNEVWGSLRWMRRACAVEGNMATTTPNLFSDEDLRAARAEIDQVSVKPTRSGIAEPQPGSQAANAAPVSSESTRAESEPAVGAAVFDVTDAPVNPAAARTTGPGEAPVEASSVAMALPGVEDFAAAAAELNIEASQPAAAVSVVTPKPVSAPAYIRVPTQRETDAPPAKSVGLEAAPAEAAAVIAPTAAAPAPAKKRFTIPKPGAAAGGAASAAATTVLAPAAVAEASDAPLDVLAPEELPELTPQVTWDRRLYRVMDVALDGFHWPFRWLSPKLKELIGWCAVATLVVAVLAALLLPILFPRRDAVDFLQDRVRAMHAPAEPAEADAKGGGAHH